MLSTRVTAHNANRRRQAPIGPHRLMLLASVAVELMKLALATAHSKLSSS
jgi:hypothetical protein